MEDTVIREMNEADIPFVARIHAQELQQSFLGQLGEAFLRKLYKIMFASPHFRCLVWLENETVYGYVAVTTSPEAFLGKIYKQHFFNLAVEIVRRAVINPIIIKKAFQVVFSKGRSISRGKNVSELLSIGVIRDCQGKGVGGRLVSSMVSILEKEKCGVLYVIVNVNIKANEFYKRLGFVLAEQFEMHGDLMNLYILKLSCQKEETTEEENERTKKIVNAKN